MKRKEPRWLRLELVLAVHESILRLHGGLAGVRDIGLLESALARPKTRLGYETMDVFRLAASDASAIVRNRPFLDGNKRTAFVAMATFLEENGQRFDASESESVVQMIALARGTLGEEEFETWLREHSSPTARRQRRSSTKSKRKRRGG